MESKSWMGLVLDGFVVGCITALLALHSIPPEAGLSLLGALIGAKAMQRGGGGGSPPGGSGDSSPKSKRPPPMLGSSVTLALVLALGGLVVGRQHA